MSLNSNKPQYELGIRDIIRIIWKRKILLIAFVLAAVILSGVLSLFVLPKEYKANATISLTPLNFTPVALVEKVTINDPVARLSQKIKADYVKSLLSPSVLSSVIEEIGLNDSPAALLSAIKLQDIDKTSFVEISVTYSDPQTAEKIASALCTVFQKKVQTERQTELEESLELAQRKYDLLQTAVKDFNTQKEAFLAEHDIEMISLELARLKTSAEAAENRLIVLERNIIVDLAYVEELKETYEGLEQVPASQIGFDIDVHRRVAFEGTSPNFEVSADTMSEALLSLEYSSAQMRIVSLSLEKTALEAELGETYDRMDSINAELLEFGGEYDELVASAGLAKSKMSAFRQRRSELTEYTEANSSAKVIQIVSEAIAGTQPVSPSVLRNVLLAGVLGLFLSLAFIYIKDVVWVTPDVSKPVSKKDHP